MSKSMQKFKIGDEVVFRHYDNTRRGVIVKFEPAGVVAEAYLIFCDELSETGGLAWKDSGLELATPPLERVVAIAISPDTAQYYAELYALRSDGKIFKKSMTEDEWSEEVPVPGTVKS